MIRISALSLRDSFLEDLKSLNKNYPELMLFYSGDNVNEFNKQYNAITDIVILDTTVFHPQRSDMLKNIKSSKPDVLILAVMELCAETDMLAWMSSDIDGILPHYSGQNDWHTAITQLFTKRKFIHPDLASLVFKCFQTLSVKKIMNSKLKPKSLKVLDLLSKGNSYAQIAEEMDTSVDSIRYYIKDIYSSLGIKSKGAAIGMYLRGQVA